MKIVVVGCGRVGTSLAIALDQQGHEVAVLDKDPGAFHRLPHRWGGQIITGFGFDRDRLNEAGATKADALAAVTNGDNSNILTARIARETYHIPNVVARIYDPRRAEIYQRLGIPTVATVTWTIEQVTRKLFPDNSVSEWSDPTGGISLVERILPNGWCGKKMSLIEQETSARIIAVVRGNQSFLGHGDLIGQEGDSIYLAVTKSSSQALDESFREMRAAP
ncbi:MAG TPA: TrkA family potassium uptake protein [Acidimicrobiales bacterium]|nr:TrkA family potassium uptake protein [Acidimicrobiales bacterium]